MRDHSDERASDWAFRVMAWMFRAVDFFHPKPNRLAGFGIREGFVVVDYGCGPGRYITEASHRGGSAGKVYAVDIHPLAINSVKKIIARLGLSNVVPVLAHGYSSEVPEATADLIYALDMFHSIKAPAAFLAELSRIAKPRCVLILEDGHQSRKRTNEKLSTTSLWRIEKEERSHIKCVAV
jgi:ubiquinone/menaquinone biosynthesis C-methylase UbiE